MCGAADAGGWGEADPVRAERIPHVILAAAPDAKRCRDELE